MGGFFSVNSLQQSSSVGTCALCAKRWPHVASCSPPRPLSPGETTSFLKKFIFRMFRFLSYQNAKLQNRHGLSSWLFGTREESPAPAMLWIFHLCNSETLLRPEHSSRPHVVFGSYLPGVAATDQLRSLHSVPLGASASSVPRDHGKFKAESLRESGVETVSNHVK